MTINVHGGQDDESLQKRADKHHRRWTVIAAIVGAVGAFGATLVTAANSLDQSQQIEKTRASEQFSRDVEQLGSDEMSVRIGATYSMARLMRESPENSQAITEVLLSFVGLQVAEIAPIPAGQSRSIPSDVRRLSGLLEISR